MDVVPNLGGMLLIFVIWTISGCIQGLFPALCQVITPGRLNREPCGMQRLVLGLASGKHLNSSISSAYRSAPQSIKLVHLLFTPSLPFLVSLWCTPG